MRILHTVEFYEPHRGGVEEVIRRVSEHLAARGHDVTVATTYHADRLWKDLNGVHVRGFKVAGNKVKGIAGEAAEYQEFIQSGKFDVIMNYAAQTWTTDLTLPLLPSLRCRKILAPVGYSRLYSRRYRAYFESLPHALAQYDGLIYHSAHYRDWEFGADHGLAEKAVIIPNGACDEEFGAASGNFRARYHISAPHIFLCVSNHYFAKGHAFVMKAFREAASRECALLIVGSPPHGHPWYSCYPMCVVASMLDDRVHLGRGMPREDVVSAYKEADLFLFGSRVECSPLVMYESFASRTPFITTNVGNISDHREVLRIVSTPRELAGEIRSYLRDPGPYRAMADKAHALFLQSHTWERIADRYEKVYKKGL